MLVAELVVEERTTNAGGSGRATLRPAMGNAGYLCFPRLRGEAERPTIHLSEDELHLFKPGKRYRLLLMEAEER